MDSNKYIAPTQLNFKKHFAQLALTLKPKALFKVLKKIFSFDIQIQSFGEN